MKPQGLHRKREQEMTTSQEVQDQLPKSNERLWVSDNGDVLCDNHAGT
jgi:hypothetical protein